MSLYCDKENVNVLTALMKRFGVRHVVVCPGSRNGVLVHNFAVDGSFVCHPVTDERSAAFVALGLCAATHGPAAVCVTSGSALLNTLPAVAEAYYRHLPLLVVSADRPPQWIGQQDGQTLPQDGALRGFTHKSVSLPEPHDAETQWWLRRLANEALSALSDGPVHVNIPVSEPLFTFTTPVLPDVQPVRRHAEPVLCALPDGVLARWQAARCPVLVVGQVDADLSDVDLRALSDSRSLLVLPEFIAQMPGAWRVQVLETLGAEQFFTPDLVFHVGGTLVGKGLKRLLRRVGAPVVRMGRDAELTDTFEHLSDVVPLAAADALRLLARTAPMVPEKAAVCQAQARLAAYRHRADAYASNRFSDLFVMQSALREVGHGDVLHLANSNSIRNAGYFLDDPAYPVLANRGVNGIEGSLSAAAGHSLATTARVFCFIGDLSFFYDQNALWNTELRGNLRILLFNNGGGQIFSRLPGLADSPAARQYIAAAHATSAEGIARAYGVRYLCARTSGEFSAQLHRWATEAAERPVLLEVFTAEADNVAAVDEVRTLYAPHFEAKK